LKKKFGVITVLGRERKAENEGERERKMDRKAKSQIC